MAGAAQFGDHPLRLAQRIGTHRHAAIRIGGERGQQPGHFASRFGMAEHRQTEGGFGDENIAGQRLEGRTGRIGPPLVIARYNDAGAGLFQHHLRRTQHMAGRQQHARQAIAQRQPLAIR